MGEMGPKEMLHLLVLPPQDKPVYFVVKGWPSPEHAAYFYDEHSCPTNFIECEAIISEGDEDPHGLFEYVRSAPIPEDYDDGCDDSRFDKLFPEVKP